MVLDGATVVVTGAEPLTERVCADLAELGARPVRAHRALPGRVDAVVYCAPTMPVDRASTSAADDVDDALSDALIGPMQLVRGALPQLLARGTGHLAVLGTGASATADDAVQRAVWSALTTFADALRLELWSTGVGVSTITHPDPARLTGLLVEQIALADRAARRTALGPAVRELALRARARLAGRYA